MSLQFPNLSRAYDQIKHCITFWGHDSTREITFNVAEDILQNFGKHTPGDEAESLRLFDGNRSLFERAAGSAYSRRRQSYLRLSNADFGGR